jgi:hypothetical protein
MKLLPGYYRYGGYQAIGDNALDRTIPRFFVFAARDQDDDVLGREPRQWLEERVELTFPGNLFHRPAFRVTDGHRKRWPKQYAAFRTSLSLWVKVRVWWHAVRQPAVTPQPHDSALDQAFNDAFEKASAERNRQIDSDVASDIEAALRKPQEKEKT